VQACIQNGKRGQKIQKRLDASDSAIFGRYSPGAVQQEVRFEIEIVETEKDYFIFKRISSKHILLTSLNFCRKSG
jgi:hypothetical protein